MKTIYLKVLASVVMIVFMNVISAQEISKVLYGTPDQYQGYFIFDKNEYPDIKQWSVDVYDLSLNEDSILVETFVKTINAEAGNNFVKLDKNLQNSNRPIKAKINGKNDVGKIIIEDDWIAPVPEGHTFWDKVCSGICNASTYAYEVQVTSEIEQATLEPVENSNRQRTKVTGAYDYYDYDLGIAIPLYRYMTQEEWSSLGSNSHQNSLRKEWNTFAHYGLPHDRHHYGPDGIKVVRYDNAVNGEYKDMYLKNLTGPTVWGVQKLMGEYYENNDAITPEIAPGAESTCGELISGSGDVQQALNFTHYANLKYNQGQLPLTEELTCRFPRPLPGSNNPGFPPFDNVKDEYKHYDFVVKSGQTVFNQTANENNANNLRKNIFNKMTRFSEIDDYFKNNTGVPWWPGNAFEVIQFYRVDRSSEPFEPVTITKRELRKGNNPPSYNIEFEKGLYNLLLRHKTGIEVPIIFEVEETMVHTFEQSKYLNAEVSPVPLANPTSKVKLYAEIPLSFDYIVQNQNGKIYINRKVNLKSNKTEEIQLNTQQIPRNSVIIHKFVFPDGSSKSITTIKE